MTKEELRALAREEGFALCGFARAGRAPHAEALEAWLQDGRQASMEWMQRTAEERGNPERVLPGVRTVVVLATNYFHDDLPSAKEPGRIARYAWSNDYHEVIRPRLEKLAESMAEAGGSSVTGRQRAVSVGPAKARWASIRNSGHGFFSRLS